MIGDATFLTLPGEDRAGATVMTSNSESNRAVLGWRDHDSSGSGALEALWRRLEQLGWLSPFDPQVVIQVGQAMRSPIVVETARSLAAYLRTRLPAISIEVLDPAARADDWPPFPLCRPAAGDLYRVSSLAAAEGLTVPALWFESHFLVTIAGAGPDPATRLSGILGAQASPLRDLGNPYPPEVLNYEAHRLAASDLSVACGYSSWNAPESERWWAVSTSDVAVDQAVAAAAGIAPGGLPDLRALARHEELGEAPTLSGSLPRLHGYAARPWKPIANRAWSMARTSARAAGRDLRLLRLSLPRIPRFVWRRILGPAR